MANCWDLERLLSDADAMDVAMRIGIPMRRNGRTTYIQCVAGTHSETRLNHMELFRDGCKCYSCGKSCNTYGMVKEYYSNVIGMPLSHDEICTIIADTCGGADQYIIKKVITVNEKGEVQKPFPLTKEDLELIGLTPKTKRARYIMSYVEDRDDERREAIDCFGYAKMGLLPVESIYTLYKEDEEAFWRVIEGKISETMQKATTGYKTFKDGNDDISKEMVQLYIDGYQKARKLAEKFFPKKLRVAS